MRQEKEAKAAEEAAAAAAKAEKERKKAEELAEVARLRKERELAQAAKKQAPSNLPKDTMSELLVTPAAKGTKEVPIAPAENSAGCCVLF